MWQPQGMTQHPRVLACRPVRLASPSLTLPGLTDLQVTPPPVEAQAPGTTSTSSQLLCQHPGDLGPVHLTSPGPPSQSSWAHLLGLLECSLWVTSPIPAVHSQDKLSVKGRAPLPPPPTQEPPTQTPGGGQSSGSGLQKVLACH